MTVPRIVFSRFERADSPKLDSWREHRSRILGSADDVSRPTAQSGAVVWQLVSGNNRKLARSAHVFHDFRDAVASATDAIEFVATEGVMSPVGGDRNGFYGWYIQAFARPVAICSRWYPAERQRWQSGNLAMEAFPRAQLTLEARLYLDAPHRGPAR